MYITAQHNHRGDCCLIPAKQRKVLGKGSGTVGRGMGAEGRSAVLHRAQEFFHLHKNVHGSVSLGIPASALGFQCQAAAEAVLTSPCMFQLSTGTWHAVDTEIVTGTQY